MLEAMLGDLRQPDRSADRLRVAGDLTGDGLPAEVTQVRQLLDGWGTLGTDYFVARGNHDRSRVGAAYESCTPVPVAPDHHDCWGDGFPYRLQQLQVHEVGGLRLVGLDAAGGTMDAGQLAALAHALHRDRDRPTLLFGHHPVTYESAATTEAGPAFDLDRPTALALQRPRQLLAPAPLHRRYMVSYYKNRTSLALAWGQRTRGEYYGLYPHYLLGTIADRNTPSPATCPG